MAASEDSPARPDRVLLLFDTTHAAMEAEENLISGGFWCDVVQRPPEARDTLCGLAIEIEAADEQDVAELLANAGISFETYKQEANDGQ